MKNLDPLIRREYKRLGMNIVPDDALADLIFAKVQYQRIRTVAITAIVLSAIVIGAFFGWRLTDTSPQIPLTRLTQLTQVTHSHLHKSQRAVMYFLFLKRAIEISMSQIQRPPSSSTHLPSNQGGSFKKLPITQIR